MNAYLNVAKQTTTDVAGTLEKPCSGNHSNAKHPVSQTLVDFTLGEVLYNPFHVNKTRITRLWKCSRRVCLCNYEDYNNIGNFDCEYICTLRVNSFSLVSFCGDRGGPWFSIIPFFDAAHPFCRL